MYLIKSVEHKLTSSYYECFRPRVLEHIPANARCILSVGCAAGVTESELVRRGVRVVGIEINHEAAVKARRKGLIVLEGDASIIDIGQSGESFDCLVYADVLEHLPDPVAVFRRHVERLKSNGTVIVSVPNFRHYSIFWRLFVLGHIRYKNGGILDHTHLRLTTRKMVLEWFDKARVAPVLWRYCLNRRLYKFTSMASCGLLKEFLAPQILVVGKKL